MLRTLRGCFVTVFLAMTGIEQYYAGLRACRFLRARETPSQTLVHAIGEPIGRELARDLRTLEQDARHHGARSGRCARPVRKLEHAAIQSALLEVVTGRELQ